MSRWTGDLRDDCLFGVGEYVAHVEKMDDGTWWAAVMHRDREWNASEATIGDKCMFWTSGQDARQFCEWLIDMDRKGRLRLEELNR